MQGTGEHATYDRATLNLLLDLGEKGCRELMAMQMDLIGELP